VPASQPAGKDGELTSALDDLVDLLDLETLEMSLLTLLDTIMVPQGLIWSEGSPASPDHATWFHRAVPRRRMAGL